MQCVAVVNKSVTSIIFPFLQGKYRLHFLSNSKYDNKEPGNISHKKHLAAFIKKRWSVVPSLLCIYAFVLAHPGCFCSFLFQFLILREGFKNSQSWNSVDKGKRVNTNPLVLSLGKEKVIWGREGGGVPH